MSPAPPRHAAEPAAAYAVRGRRQTAVVLTVATLLGIWLGTSAPGVSPVSTPAAVTPAAVVQDPVPLGPGGPGRRR